MKKLVLLVSLVLVSLSCTQKGQYTITGTSSVSDLDGKYVYLVKYSQEGIEKSDSVAIKDGKFSFKGVQETPEVYYLLAGEGESEKRHPILLEPGKISVDISQNMTVAGTPVNDAYQQFVSAQAPFEEKMNQLDEEYANAKKDSTLTEEMEESLETKGDDLYMQMKGVYTDYLTGNINNLLGQEVFKMIGRRLDADQLATVLGKADDTFKTTQSFKDSQMRLEIMQKVAIGQKFTDIVSKNTEGNPSSLSDYAGKGKYVLLDFWASWCPPCRKEMPNLVELYKQYKGKNFEIVGYSLDKDEEAWKKGLVDLNMTWPQLSDIQFWQSEPVKMYAVQGIPHTILLDPNGVIIEKDLRGKKMAEKLQELLK